MTDKREAVAIEFLKSQPETLKYFNPKLAQKVAERMQLPTRTAAKIAFQSLIEEGLERTDGHDDAWDYEQLRNRLNQGVLDEMEKVREAPLTKDEVEYFMSLSAAEQAELYWQSGGCNSFRVRFDKAIAAGYWPQPAKPSNPTSGLSSCDGTTGANLSPSVRSRL